MLALGIILDEVRVRFDYTVALRNPGLAVLGLGSLQLAVLLKRSRPVACNNLRLTSLHFLTSVGKNAFISHKVQDSQV